MAAGCTSASRSRVHGTAAGPNDSEASAARSKITGTAVSRRRLLKTGCAALAVVARSLSIPKRARANPKTLKILKWIYPVSAYDDWFIETYVKEWGERNDTQVLVDRVGLGEVNSRAMAEAENRQGHDLIMLLTPGARYEDQVIDHREIYEECERRYGKVTDFAVRSTYNPRTKKYSGFPWATRRR
jgi:multiple sugar transport system substrate-binding protein